MPDYLLECDCGKSVRVTTQQAGGEAVCECGKRLSVPTLRKIRSLPVAEEIPSEYSPQASWGLRNQLVSIGAVVTLLLAGLTAYSYMLIPEVPKFADFRKEYIRQRDAYFDSLDPAAAFMDLEMRVSSFAINGANEIERIDAEMMRVKARNQSRIVTILASATGVTTLLTVLSAVLLPSPKRPSPKRG